MVLGLVGPCQGVTRSPQPQERCGFVRPHPTWHSRQAEIAAVGGADRRSAKNADAPLNQSREAHLAARPLHSPEGAHQRHGAVGSALLFGSSPKNARCGAMKSLD
jgi:hypothetical protein